MTFQLLAMIVSLTNSCGSARIDTYGALVDSYIPKDGGEVFFRQAGARATNEWYNGGVPVCWPWFDMEGEPGSGMHGFARLREWKVLECENGVQESRAILTLEERDRFQLKYEVKLGSSLSLRLSMRNTGKTEFLVTTCLHPYFAVSNPENVEITTPDGTIVRGQRGMDGPKSHLPGVYDVVDKAMGRRLSLEMIGNNACVVWNIGPDEILPGLDKEDWKRYICIEPAIMPRSRGIRLLAGEERSIGMVCRLVE